MTQLTRTQRGLLNVLDGFTILIVFAALILVVYRAVYGATHSLTTAPLMLRGWSRCWSGTPGPGKG